MLTVETKVKIPFLWGKTVFKKSNWAQINLIVGPNGSGKTLLAQKISEQFEAAGYSVKFLKERLAGPLAERYGAVGFELWICNVTHDVLGELPGSKYIHDIV